MLHLQADMNITVQLEGDMGIVNQLDGELAVIQETSRVIPYSGQTEVTPSSETQILETEGFTMLDNITINPIPNNYGLITWNGSTLTVS